MNSKVIAPLSDERRTELMAKLMSEPSDTKLSLEFGISRKALWRMRQNLKDQKITRKAVAPAPVPLVVVPAPKLSLVPPLIPKVPPLIPKVAVPRVEVPKVLKSPPLPPPLPLDPRPKVDVEPVFMNTYFAVQVLPYETYKHVANAVLTEADAKKVLFRKLQVMDIVSVGTTSFVRFRGDLPNAFVLKALRGRAVIVPDPEGTYTVTFPNGRSGKFPVTTMCSAPKIGFGHTYAGTRIKLWKQQFASV